MGEVAQDDRLALIKSRCQKVLLHAEHRVLHQWKTRILKNSELLKSTQISLVATSVSNEFKKVHLCAARYRRH